MVQNFFNDELSQFFEQFNSTENILEWLKEHEVSEHAGLLVQSNNTQMLRKLVIMKEGGSDEFKGLYKRYSSFLKKKHPEKESPYDEMYEVFSTLDDYFLT